MAFQPKAFSEAVEKALQEVCPSSDPIDKPDFDPIAFLNNEFPDEGSLGRLTTFHENIMKRLQQTETELFRAVEVQTTSASAAARDLREVSGTVNKLNERVAEIRKKATKSEDTVRELCQNIRQLDTAKSNLTESVNTLRFVQMWMLQLQTLQVTFDKRNYVQCRDALKEVQKYSTMFEKYKDVPKVKELNEKQANLCRQIEYKIRNNVIGDMTNIDVVVMAEACAVIDALGMESIKKVRDKYIERELDLYGTKFKRGSEDARLEKAEKRYVFIRHLLESNKNMFETVFPRHWCVPQELCVTFCIRTKTDFDYLLKESAGNLDVAILTYVLQKTIDLERDLTQLMAWHDNLPERHQLSDYKYNGMILSAFKAHMGLFVQNENKLMEELIQGKGEDENLRDDANLRPGATMTLAEDIFVFINFSLKRTIKVAQQHILLDMSGVWKSHLLRFCAGLQATVQATVPSTPAQFRKACVMINTADMCQSTAMTLGEKVALRAEVGVDEVNFEDVSQAFSALYTASITSVVTGLDKLLAPALQEFSSGNFMRTHGDDSTDESAYVGAIRRNCHDVVSTCATVLLPQILRFLLDKIASTIIPKYTLYFYRLRQPTPNMVIQMRVDSSALEKMFVALPNVGNPDRFPPTMLSHYTKLVRREFDRFQRALKVLQCEATNSFVDVYYQVTAEEDRSIQNFMKLVDLKGLNRADVRQWIVTLGKKGVVESTKRDAMRENQIQTLSVSSPNVGNSGGGNVVSNAANSLLQSASGVFTGGSREDGNPASPVVQGADSVAAQFRKVIRPMTFLNNLKERVTKDVSSPSGK